MRPRRPRPARPLRPLALALLLAGGGAAAAAGGRAAALVGTWEAVAVERAGKREPLRQGKRTRVTFFADGRLLAVERRGGGEARKRGRWSVSDGFLVTQVEQRVDLARFRVRRDRLELARRGGPGRPGFTMIMRRVGR